MASSKWTEIDEIWKLMSDKEQSYSTQYSNPMSDYPEHWARSRAVLVDWLSEVRDVYALQRETFYLAVDYLDRLMFVPRLVPKTELQLVGITCLFIAAKVQEIYPPKLEEFVYVTDGICGEHDILEKEILILQALDWKTTPMTVNAWLILFLQTDVFATTLTGETMHLLARDFLLPSYSDHFCDRVSQLLDVCILDPGSASFAYSVLAASALYHFSNKDKVLQCTGLSLGQIRECVMWMAAAATAIRDNGYDEAKRMWMQGVSPTHMEGMDIV